MSLDNQREVLEPVSQVLQGDGDLREQVRQLVLKALAQRQWDPAAWRSVMGSALEGIGVGLGQRAGQAGEAMKEAVTGLDEAMGGGLYALRKAVEEGMDQGRQFARSDLQEAYESVKGMEQDLLDLIRSTGERAQGALRTDFESMGGHLRRAGTDTGRQVGLVLEALGNRLNAASAGSGQEARETAQEAGGRLRQVASGILRGLADALDKRSA